MVNDTVISFMSPGLLLLKVVMGLFTLFRNFEFLDIFRICNGCCVLLLFVVSHSVYVSSSSSSCAGTLLGFFHRCMGRSVVGGLLEQLTRSSTSCGESREWCRKFVPGNCLI